MKKAMGLGPAYLQTANALRLRQVWMKNGPYRAFIIGTDTKSSFFFSDDKLGAIR